MVSDFQMRVSDADREAAAAELREHYAAGRLTTEELNDRLDKAFAARTRADLNTLMTDLPSARPGGAWTGGASNGPAGARPSGWDSGSGWSVGSGWGDSSGRNGGGARQSGPASAIGALVVTFAAMCALLLLGTLGVFGIGAGRPFAIVLLLAAFALLRRLLFRRRVRASRRCGPRRRW